jgi:GNAT superfamily N-acetyltransferase
MPPIWIRPYESADADRVRAMSARLSRRSLYERFFSGMPSLPPMYLAALARVDHHDREALLALTGDAVIGTAEYVRDHAAPDHADLAVLVADDWQQRGLARRLVTALAVLAASRGIAIFKADVLLNNRSALAAIAGGWPQARPQRDGTTAHFELPISVPPDHQQAPAAAGQLPDGHKNICVQPPIGPLDGSHAAEESVDRIPAKGPDQSARASRARKTACR